MTLHPDNAQLRRPLQPGESHSVLTIGYGGDTLEGFIKRLGSGGVTHVADVRSMPYSRHRPEFNGPELQYALKAVDVEYVFLGAELGGRPDDAECYTPDGRVDYASVRARDYFKSGLERVRRGVERCYKVCLLCSEGRPETCHRTKLIGEALVDTFGFNVVHIEVDGCLTPHAEVMERVKGGQQTFEFDDRVHHSVQQYSGDGSRR
ncbi:MAG: DUF488 domain-containing protein [Acidimicrobiia bacterium]|nr:DUF488 domain-containing protein [Acidimicrobiia bacterium]